MPPFAASARTGIARPQPWSRPHPLLLGIPFRQPPENSTSTLVTLFACCRPQWISQPLPSLAPASVAFPFESTAIPCRKNFEIAAADCRCVCSAEMFRLYRA
jgi:hypothetical protein